MQLVDSYNRPGMQWTYTNLGPSQSLLWISWIMEASGDIDRSADLSENRLMSVNSSFSLVQMCLVVG